MIRLSEKLELKNLEIENSHVDMKLNQTCLVLQVGLEYLEQA